jgi:uncharacterized protein YbbC (DUF1343 family)/CubicO group peptidase (beta-lactamase class C family)
VKRRARILFSLLCLLILSLTTPSPVLPRVLSEEELLSISQVIEEAIQEGQTPGAVVIIGNQDEFVLRRSYGNLTPGRQGGPMTLDTVFDIASLTKVVATTTALLQFWEQGKVSLEDPVSRYWPEFKAKGKEPITLRHLLTHYSGLRPGLPLKGQWSGCEETLKRIKAEKLRIPPGSRFVYSDLNFIILGEVVQRLSGISLDRYCLDHIFQPLGMRNTGFNPSVPLFPRLAPTRENHIGEVHDPLARRMGGVAGHAGLFSTAEDLAIFAQALLDGGRSPGGQILKPSTVEQMIRPCSPAGQKPLRGLGWAIHSPSESDFGESLPPGSYGHKGYTGTLIWIDPVTRTYLIILSNRVYGNGNGKTETVRDRVLSLVAQALGREPLPEEAKGGVQTGIDVWAANQFAPLSGKRLGLITNHSGLDSTGRRTVDLLQRAPGVKLKAIFNPEHGLSGTAEGKVSSTHDPSTQLPVYSLYGDTLRPTPEMLQGLDALVFDLQDVGVRFYTYITTLGYALEAAAQEKISFYVLDRPNPINASMVQGPVMDPDLKSFTGYFPLPIRHGMTVGELARMFNSENKMQAKLQVIQMNGYRRSCWFDQTGLPWVNPSPNLRSLTQAILYPGVALVEGSNVSVGRGTDQPFELLGSPWIRAKELADYLNHRKISGVEFQPAVFTPGSEPFKGEVCFGVQIVLLDRQALDSPLLGIEIISALYRLYPEDFQVDKTLPLIGSQKVLQAIKEDQDPQRILQGWQQPLRDFLQLRAKYLLYPELTRE